MDFNHIDLYLEKFKKILSQTSFQKETILSVISEEIKFELKSENLKIKNNIVILSGVSPIVKNEIFLHKEKIFKRLNDVGVNISDIR
jgi:hypothetical protein